MNLTRSGFLKSLLAYFGIASAAPHLGDLVSCSFPLPQNPSHINYNAATIVAAFNSQTYTSSKHLCLYCHTAQTESICTNCGAKS